MRPLNRPMFKYGGPIKEGIMHGMQDGGLANNEGPRRAALVGNPIYDQTKGPDGRTKHIVPFLIGAGGMAARILAPRAIMGGLRSLAGGLRSGQTVSAFDKGIGGMQRLRNLLPTGRFLQPATPKGQVIPGKYQPAPLRFSEAIKSPEVIGKAIRENPFTAFGVAGQIKNIPDILGGAYDIAEGTLQAGANYLLGTEFGRGDKKAPIGDGTGLKRGDKDKNVGDITGTTKPGEAGGTTAQTAAEKQQINEARIQETKDKYYKLMGIDNMKKEAIYDSLIDASKAVQEEGADLKGSIRSGALQNKIISAISKNLDKSADIKRQIDAAILKGEIEKDIKSADTLDSEYKKAQIALAKKKLEGPSAADIMSSATIDGKNIVTSDTLTQVLSGMGRDVDYTFPDDKYQKWEKKNEGKDEIDYLQENYGGLDDGLYVVNKKAFEIKGGTVFPVDLDKITG